MSSQDGKPKKLNQIKSSLFSRGLSVAKLGLNAGIKYAGTKIANKSFDDFVTSQAGLFTKEFGELKGSLMKAGQMLSMYGEYFFPPQANQVLKTLQSDSPAIEWAVMRSYLEQYFTDEQIVEIKKLQKSPTLNSDLNELAKKCKFSVLMTLEREYQRIKKDQGIDVYSLKK